MAILLTVLRVGLIATIIVVVAELSKRHPQVGALILSLRLVSILTILMSWFQHHDLPAICRLSRGTLILVPLGLPFFVPLAFGNRMGLGFWPSFMCGIVLASLTIGSFLLMGPRG